jgi:hypothetical protein
MFQQLILLPSSGDFNALLAVLFSISLATIDNEPGSMLKLKLYVNY